MDSLELKADDALDLFGLRGVEPRCVVFWTGAGISADTPTCVPLGEELTRRALEYAFQPTCLDRIVDVYRSLRVTDRRELPRLETVLDVVRRFVGVDGLLDVLNDLVAPAPNDLHRFFAHHLASGGRHITANFDDCIERAGGTADPADLLHFHGSFAADPTGASLGATLGNIQSGFPVAIVERLRTTLAAPEVTTVVFVGYSDYDTFDVDPFLRSLAPERSLEGKTVVWIRFLRSGDDTLTVNHSSPLARVADSLALLSEAGARCFDVHGDPRAVLAALAKQWRTPVSRLMPPPPRGHSAWHARLSTVADVRGAATVELYSMMGMRSDVRRMFAEHPPSTSSELQHAAEATAADGRYRDAAEQWRMAIVGSSPADRARRELHVASCWWLQGRMLKAYRHLRRELVRAEEAGVSGEPLWHLVAITAYVFGHMRRRPLLRFFPTARRRRFLARRLPPADPTSTYGPHMDALLAAARSRLGLADERSDERSLMFDEAEALHGMLNFRHASLRRRGRARDRREWPEPHEYSDQQNDFRALGLNADVVRVPLLPGASRLFNPIDVWRGLSRPQFTPWHRLTLFGGYLLRYALHR
jgi:hypothetical protein